VRIVDLVLRQGHLSEDAIMQAILEGRRPAHLDQCDICAHRALDLGRWLDDVKTTADEAVEEAFPVERLAAQQAQIMRRLAQLDEPARVIAFPAAPVASSRDMNNRRVAPAWVGFAAAAGLVVGVVGSQMAARLEQPQTRQDATATAAPATTPVSQPPTHLEPAPSILEWELDRVTPRELQVIDELTPRLMQTSYTLAQSR
jgi:hypothetical protein